MTDTAPAVCPACERPFAERRRCADCGQAFDLDADQVRFFLRQKLAVPRRCAPCRVLRKRQQN